MQDDNTHTHTRLHIS